MPVLSSMAKRGQGAVSRLISSLDSVRHSAIFVARLEGLRTSYEDVKVRMVA